MLADTRSPISPAVIETALAGRRLEAATLVSLAGVTDILALGALADDARRRRHGTAATYVRVHAFDLAGTPAWTVAPPAAHEGRVIGAPATAAAAVDAVRRARTLAGAAPLRGFDLATVWPLGGAALLRELREAGLDELATVEPAHGAIDAVTAARAAGLGVRVVGLALPVADRAAWLLEVRALIDAIGGGIDAVAPLARTADPSTPTTGFDDVRSIALARLALETVPSIQVDWQRHGPKLAQVALTVGADDLDLVSADDDVSRGPRRAPLEEARRNIAAAALVPVERDGRFSRIPG